MHIVFVTYDYPSKARPFYGAFVRNFIRAIARVGIKCIVINPVSIFHRRYGILDPVITWDKFIHENPIEVRKPRYFSASSKNLFLFNTESITLHYYHKAVQLTIEDLKPKPDVLYGHFIYPSGAVVAKLGSEMKTTSIVAVGEDTTEDFTNKDRLFKDRWDIRQISGVVAVSTVNKKRCIDELLINEDKVIMLPNGVDFSLFYPRDQIEMRRKYNLPINKIIIAFTGHFENRKGPNRILEAIKGIDGIGIVLIGSGKMKLENSRILFKGVIEHDKVPEMLSASDMFVLPTLSEGSCNAILEAMACGLPVVSSLSEYNNDILNADTAIQVDPLNITQIRKAILSLKQNIELRKKMSEMSLKHVKQFDVILRTRILLGWINKIRQCNYNINKHS